MGVKFGRSHWGRNIGWGCSRIGCWHLGLRVTRWQGGGGGLCSVLLTKYHSDDQIRIRWSGHVARTGNRRDAYRGDMREGDHLEDIGVDGWITLIGIFKKWNGKSRTWLIWLTIGTGGGHFWMWLRTCSFYIIWRTPWQAGDMLANQEGLSWMELYSFTENIL